jgi:hypothetical protein
MINNEWQVVAESDECVFITIDESVDLEGLELTLINDVRIPIVKLKVNSREIHICSHTEKPMFAQLGNSVKYVKGSGKSMYNQGV